MKSHRTPFFIQPLITATSITIAVLIAASIPSPSLAAFGDTTDYVGQLKYGDGLGKTDAYFDFPEDIASDGNGNFYIADTFNGVIRKIDSNGTVSTAVGAGGYGDVNGSGNQTKFAHPGAVSVDTSGNIYIADSSNGKIKKFDGQKTTTLKSDLGRPEGIFVRNNTIYFTDYQTGKLYSMSTNGSNFKTVASGFNGPKKLYVRTSNDYAYLTDALNYTVVRVKLSNGSKEILAGKSGDSGKINGFCSVARFKNIWGITVVEGASLDEDDVYVTDGTGDPGNIQDRDIFIQNTVDNGKVRVIDLNGSDIPEMTDDSDNTASNIAMNTTLTDLSVTPTASACETYLFVKERTGLDIGYPNALTRYGDNIYVALTGSSQIMQIELGNPDSAVIWAGRDRFHNQNGAEGLPGRPKDLVITKDRKKIYFSENNQIRMITTKKRRVKHIVGSTIDNYQKNDDKGWSEKDGRFSDALALDISPDEKTLYVVDRNNNRIREVNIATQTVYYLTGAGETNIGGGFDNGYREGRACPNQFETGIGNCAYFTRPGGIAVDSRGKYAYVADTGNQVIRRVKLKGTNKGKTRLVAGLAGQSGFKNGTKTDVRFNVPIAITIDKKDNNVFVADRNNHVIRKVRLRDGKTTTLAGRPGRAGYLDGKLNDAILNLPVEVYYNGGDIYFSEAGTHRIRVVDMTDRAVKLVSGDGMRGYANGKRKNAQFDNPVGLVRKGKNLLVADSQNDLFRKISLGNGEDIPYTEDPPQVDRVSPASNKVAGRSTDTKSLQIFGSDFRHGAIASFGPYKANATFVNSDSEISVVIPFGLMAPGYYEVKVENTDGQVSKRLRGYSVSDNDGNVPLTDYFAN